MALDFSNISPWQDIVRCNVAPNGAVSNIGSATLNDEDLRVMVRIPKFWVKADAIIDGIHSYRWFISSTSQPGYEVHPAFYQRSASAPADYIYVGAYEASLHSGTTTLTSITGVAPHVNIDIGAMKKLAYTINSDKYWGITNVWTRNAVELLCMIEYGNMDSQANIGAGITGAGAASNTGADNIENNLDSEGTGQGDAADNTSPVCYRWMENLWGNVWAFLDGIEVVDANYRILKRDGTWDETGPSDEAGVVPYTVWDSGDYEESTAIPITTDGYIKDIVSEDLLKYLMIPSVIGGSSSTYIPDYFYGHDSGEANLVLAGGAWSSGGYAGLAYRAANDVVSYGDTSVGGRLEYIP